MTLEEAARLMDWGKSSLQRIEKGQNQRIRSRDLDGLLEIYGIDGEQAAGLRGLAQQAAEKSWWHEFGDAIPANFSVYMGLESAATGLRTYQPDLVPGLLQTADYARVLVGHAFPGMSALEIDNRVRPRLTRQSLIGRKTKPATLEVILGETVLRRVIGGPAVMATQLRYLADAGTRPNISVRALPFAAGMPTGDQIGPFVILSFPNDSRGEPIEPTIVYAENYTGDMYSEKTNVVQRYERAYQTLLQASLDEVGSRTMLRKIAREYESDH
jgi:hypothetical protein